MKKYILCAVVISFVSMAAYAQKKPEDKSKRPSPPATATQKLTSGATITIDYSQPSLKGRTIGKDIEPMEGKVWRTGANEATVFQTDQDVKVNGASLPAGKYSLFTIFQNDAVTFIFNKTWNQWGAFGYKEADDQLRIQTKLEKSSSPSEKMTFTISNDGIVTLLWGDRKASFKVSE